MSAAGSGTSDPAVGFVEAMGEHGIRMRRGPMVEQYPILMAFQHFELPDGNLGLGLHRKSIKAQIIRLGVRKGKMNRKVKRNLRDNRKLAPNLSGSADDPDSRPR